jgi:hypothetical protein
MELYCIKTHSKNVVTKGNVYPMIDKKNCKSCGYVHYDVGVRSDAGWDKCGKCTHSEFGTEIWWVGSELFANIDDINIEEAIEALEELQEV